MYLPVDEIMERIFSALEVLGEKYPEYKNSYQMVLSEQWQLLEVFPQENKVIFQVSDELS